jgi:YVTN family beta-propeller protein
MFPLGVAITPNGGFAYVSNDSDNTVSVIGIANNTVVATVPLPGSDSQPSGVVIAPNGSSAYVVNNQTVSVISTASNTVTATISVPPGGSGADGPGLAISADGTSLYVSLPLGNIAVVSTAAGQVVATISTNQGQRGSDLSSIAISPNGALGYATLQGPGVVAVFNTNASSNLPATTIPVGDFPTGVALTRSGGFAYVTNANDNTVSVISTASNTVVAVVAVVNQAICCSPHAGKPRFHIFPTERRQHFQRQPDRQRQRHGQRLRGGWFGANQRYRGHR